MSTISNLQFEAYILQLLDDYRKHDWDDILIAADEGLAKVGMKLESRQEWGCLANLIASGKVIENWDGDFATLRRVKIKPVVSKVSRTLFGD